MKRVTGKLIFAIEPIQPEVGKAVTGEYRVSLAEALHRKLDTITLLKDASSLVVGLGGITTVKFLHIKVVFDDPTVADANIELIINDGGADQTFTGTQFMLVDTDIASIKITNNSNDSTGSDAQLFIDLAGD